MESYLMFAMRQRNRHHGVTRDILVRRIHVAVYKHCVTTWQRLHNLLFTWLAFIEAFKRAGMLLIADFP